MSNRGGANLPLARVKTIMKSSPEVETVTQESLFLITRATVKLFTHFLAKIEILQKCRFFINSPNFSGTVHHVPQ